MTAVSPTLAAGRLARRAPGRAAPPALVTTAVAVAAVLVIPLAYLVIRTLGAGGDAWELLARPRTIAIVGRTLLLVASVTAAAIVIAVPLAWLTTRTDLPGRRTWAVITVLPLVLPSYVAAFTYTVALGPRGVLQQLLEAPFGVERLPSIFGFPGAFLTLTLLTYPYILLPAQAGLRRLDPAYGEVGRTLGLSSWGAFRRVTLPMLRPAVAAGALLVALYTLSDFGAVSLLRYETFTFAILVQFESAFDRTLAATFSLALIVLAVLILTGEAATRGRARYHQTSTGSSGRASPVRLGRWKWPALGAVGLLACVALAIPLAVLAFWFARGLATGQVLPELWEPLRNSLFVSALAAVVAALAALPVAALVTRHPGRVAWLVERAAYIGFALPGIAVAMALVSFGVNVARPLYQTTGLLIVGYLILFFPATLGPIRSALLQVSPRIEEAARTLGRSPLRVTSDVTVPLALPGFLAGAALVFLLTMKELPATLILGPIGFKTLATVTWSAASEAFFAQAAAAALVTVAVSSAPLALLLLRRRRETPIDTGGALRE